MAKRAGRAPAPVTSSKKPNSRKDGGRRQPRTGPKTIHDVYDYAVEQANGADSGKRNKPDRSIARAKLGAGDGDMNDIQGSSRPRPRRRRDDDGEDDSDIDSGSDSDQSQSRRNAGPSFLDVSDGEDGGTGQGVASEDDSDIDSDEAFADSDDEMGLGGGNKSKRRATQADSEDEASSQGEDADDFEDDEGSDVIDLSRLLDEPQSTSQADGIFDSGDEEDASEAELDDDEEEEEDTHDRLARLAASYAQASSKRSADDDEEASTLDATGPQSKKQRRLLSARTEGVPESEYAATSSGSRGPNIGIDDLLGSLQGRTPGDLSALRASTKSLRQQQPSSSSDAARQPVASRRGGGALSAPLPDNIKNRLQRSAGYDLSKEEADKWQSTIKRLREAEHLSFPLQGGPSRPKPTTARMAASYKPSNALEQDIESLLQAQGLSEAQIAKHEELAMRKIDPEEVQRRRDELRQMRELMFRAEQKAKRTNKIKSKTYRKIARKDKERQREKMIAAGILPDADDDDEDDGEQDASRSKAERARAKERATLKHKNTGKWAKAMLGRKEGHEDEETRDAINEQLQRSDQLRRRIQGRGDDDDDDDSDEGDAGSDSDADPLQSAFDEIKNLDEREAAEAAEEEAANGTDNTGKKGVWNMKFMKDARSRDDAAANQSRRELEADLRRMDSEKAAGDGEGGDDSDSDDDDMAHQPAVGRRTFASKQAPSQQRSNASRPAASTQPLDSDDDDDAEPAVASESPKVTNDKGNRGPLSQSNVSAPVDDDGENPWLAATGSSKKKTKAVPGLSSAAGRSALKLDKHKAKGATERAAADDDAQVDIDPNALLATRETSGQSRIALQLQPPPPATKQQQQQQQQRAEAPPVDSDSSSSEDEAEPIEVYSKGRRGNKAALSQRDLIAEAFAGDDVQADFALSKAKTIAEDAPQEVDDNLPGWGSWGGKGAKKHTKSGAARRRERDARVKIIPGLDPSKRKDANMSNVIINERRDKKLDKYRAKELPYPYTSAQQYQASIAQPIGPEWNTTTQNQRLVMPRVLQTKPGAVIKPVQRIG